MIDEVRSLLEKGIDKERMLMFGMEYSHVSRYLCEEITFDEMKESLRHDIHRLAKRQMTWFRGWKTRNKGSLDRKWRFQCDLHDH